MSSTPGRPQETPDCQARPQIMQINQERPQISQIDQMKNKIEGWGGRHLRNLGNLWASCLCNLWALCLGNLWALSALAVGASPALPQGPPAWTRGAVCYEVFVRSFFDSDGDGIGDLNGLAARLDYIND